jgi:hypothetical protein
VAWRGSGRGQSELVWLRSPAPGNRIAADRESGRTGTAEHGL